MPKVRIDPKELPEESRSAYRRSLEALDLMRTEGLSLTAAADRAGTTRRTMLKYVGRSLDKDQLGQYEAKPWDRFLRYMRFPTPRGLRELKVKDSRSAQRLARYWNDVRAYLLGIEGPEILERYRNLSITVDGEEHTFVTDSEILRRLALAGEVQFNELYADV